ncbi:MAG: PKD domain-containing protein [Ginsengibacter sp.]
MAFIYSNGYSQVQFIENKGQWDAKVKFMSDAGDGKFFLQDKGYTITQYRPDDVKNLMKKNHDLKNNIDKAADLPEHDTRLKSHAYSVEFLNAQTPEIVPEKTISTVNNYFIGNDPSKWAANCKIYQAVLYKNVYPGIDIRYYMDISNSLKYDMIVHPGADISKIALRYKGINALSLKKKELVITTPLGESKELQPYTFQTINNERKEVDCQYEVKGDIVKFKIKNYQADKILIIDPSLVFFSYSGSTSDNWGFTATYGADGSIYGGGIVFGNGFPTTPGEQSNFNGGTYDIGIIKLSANGKNKLYATYLGGSGSEQPHSLIEDSKGNLVIAGRTNSPNYPTKGKDGRTYAGSGSDIIVTKLNQTGSAIIGSMQIGGSGEDGVNIVDRSKNEKTSLKRNYGDDARSEVLLDGNDNIYVAGCSRSSNFPTTPGAYQRTMDGAQDAVVLKISPDCDNLIFSTLLGGDKEDAAYVLVLGQNNSIYVAGGTASPNFPAISKSGVYKSNYSTATTQDSDAADGFIVEMSNDGSKVLRGTYIGTEKADQVYGIETDVSGNIYVMGISEGQMQPINAAYFNQGSKQFITKFDPDLNKIIYQTIFGSVNSTVPNISPTAFLVDRCENVYVSGWGGYANFPYLRGNVLGMPVTDPQLIRNHAPNPNNFYFIVIGRNAEGLLFGSYYGQRALDIYNEKQPTYGDHVDGGTSRFDKRGIIYQAECADCGGRSSVGIIGTPGVWAPMSLAQTQSKCNLGLMKIEMDFSGVYSAIRSSIYGQPGRTNGCVPVEVLFEDTLRLGKAYQWLFGDGSPQVRTTVPSITHIYSQIGTYKVRLITIDSSLTCHPEDTSYTTINIGNNRVSPDFSFKRLPPCESLDYTFTNTTTNYNGAAYKPGSFTWDLNDGTPPFTTDGGETFQHKFASEGIYNVKLSIDDAKFCNSPADTIKSLHIALSVKAKISTPPTGCAPYTAVFTNQSAGGAEFTWDFGDGSGRVQTESATHLYQNPGTYTVKLIAYDAEACNKIDSTEVTITVNPKPSASFSFSPLEPIENTFTQYDNKSFNADTYTWDFGDGEKSTDKNPRHIFPATGTYNVCLSAMNSFGCADTTCAEVKAIIRPLLAVPNAFTPHQPGPNSSIKVIGFGIVKMQWTIYNRWGQKVFEANNPDAAWDGTFKGLIQPIDVYTYTLDAELSNGKKVRQTGDITLLR